MIPEELIPQHKSDLERANKLKNHSFEDIRPIVPDLLEWLQDINWPVAKPIIEYLVPYTEYLSPHLVQILQGKDEMWKYWCIEIFCSSTNQDLSIELTNELKRIADLPTPSEIADEVNLQAQEALQGRSLQ